MLRAFLVGLIMVFCLGCGRPEVRNIGSVINAPGKYKLDGGAVRSVEIKPTPDGGLRLTVFTKTGATSPVVDLAKGWFVYPETADHLWLCFGANDLVLMEFDEKKDSSRSVLKDRSLIPKIPRDVLSQLPEELNSKITAQPKQ